MSTEPPALADRFFTLSSVSGSEFRRFRADLRHFGTQLADLHSGEMARLIARALDTVSNATCRIAVIGHAKAGKTTLVNALIQKPGFLPCRRIAPTAAITRVHLGVPTRPASQAVFEFVGEDEWYRIAAQAGRLDYGADSTSSPLNADLAQVRLEQMRLRIEQRLGGDFRRLFGQKHEYDHVTSDVLARYVCADLITAGAGRAGQAGQYAGMTARADVYCDDNPFSYPVTVVDTPGLLDPHLLRNQPSIQEVECADAVIVVLCPRQLATAWDPGFLQIMRRLPSERVIIYINQIDTIAGEHIVPLINRTQAQLRSELQADIPVLAGSLQGPGREIGGLLEIDAQRPELALSAGSRSPSNLRFDDTAKPATAAKSEHGAGIATLVSQFWRRLSNGPHARALVESATTLHAVARARESSTRAQADAVSKSIVAARNERLNRDAELQQIESHISKITLLCDGIGRSCDAVAADVAAIQGDGAVQFEKAIRDLIEPFITDQCLSLEQAFTTSTEAQWTCDTAHVAQAIDGEIAETYRNLRLRLRTALSAGVDSIRDAVLTGLPEMADQMPNLSHAGNFSIPPFEILSGPIAFQLDQSWRRRWLHRRGTAVEIVAEFKKTLALELERALAATLQALNRALAGDGAAILQGLSGRSITVIDLLVGRREQLSTTAKELLALRDDRTADAKLDAYLAEHQRLEKTISAAARLDQSFGELVVRGAMMFGTSALLYERASN